MASSEWTCSRCTYKNSGTRRKCKMCYSRRQDMTQATLESSSKPVPGDCWTCNYNVQPNLDNDSNISQETAPKALQFETAQTALAASNQTQVGNLPPPQNIAPQLLQQGNPQQVAVTGASQTQAESLSLTSHDDDSELITMRKEIQELEKQLEIKEKRAKEKNILQTKLQNIRAQIQDYDNPPNDSRTKTDKSTFEGQTNTGLDSQINKQNVTNFPREQIEQQLPNVLYQTGEWACSACTLHNPDTVTICGACRTPRPQAFGRLETVQKRNIITAGSLSDSIVSTTSSADFSIDISQLRRDLEDVDISAKTDPCVGNPEWNCIYCTYRNTEDTRVCRLCGKKRTCIQGSDTDNTITSPEDINIEEQEEQNKVPDIIASSAKLETSDLRLVMIGPTGTGKSTTGNTILGRNAFTANMSAVSVTKRTKLCKSYRYRRSVSIVDTPGIFDTNVDNEYVTHEILKCVGLTAPGPHAVLLVVNVSVRFSYENQESVKFFVRHFGDDLFHYLIIVFTRKDELERNNITIEKYLETIPKELEAILARCSNRYIAFNNVANDLQKDRQVKELFQMIDHMIQQNKGQYYTNEIYNETDKKIRKRMAKIYKRLEEERMLRIHNIRKEQYALIQMKFEQMIMDKKKTTGRKPTKSECSELQKIAVTETQIVMQKKIDDVDAKLKPLMQNSALRSTAQKEIEDEKPGAMALLKKGALKFLKVTGMGAVGALASPFVALGGAIGTVAIPFITAVSAAMSDSSDENA